MKQVINEQIATLRKQSGMTQKELAAIIGVSGQAVSKWESGVCCPDMGLLIPLADVFGVSLDILVGRTPLAETNTEDPIDILLRHQAAQSREDAANFACEAARALHAGLFALYVDMPNSNEAVSHARAGEWGVSAISEPAICTRMNCDAVFFSGNRCEGSSRLPDEQIQRLSALLRKISSKTALSTLFSIFRLTAWNEDMYVSAEEIGKDVRLATTRVDETIEKNLDELVISEERDGMTVWRIREECMDIVPLLTLLVRL